MRPLIDVGLGRLVDRAVAISGSLVAATDSRLVDAVKSRNTAMARALLKEVST
jgi:hypothetical protein